MRLRGTTTIFLLLFGLAAARQAIQANESEKHSGKKPMAASTKVMSTSSFVTHAMQSGMAAVAVGRMVVDRTQDPDLRQFAQRMIDDHGRANDELKQLAERKKWKVPGTMSAKDQMGYYRLREKAGADFDREYAKAMLEHHDHDVMMFEAYSEKGKDADLKSWAANTLPALRDHQQMARSNAGKLGVSVASYHDRK